MHPLDAYPEPTQGLAAQRQIERDNLDELIADFDETHGPADPEAVAAKRAKLTGTAPSGTGAAA